MIRGGDVGRMPAAWAVGTVSLAVTAELLPRMSAASWWSWVVDRGMVVAPAALWVPGRPVVGAASLHGELVGMLERLGHRGDLTHPSPSETEQA